MNRWYATIPPLTLTLRTSKKGRKYVELFGLLEGELRTVQYRASWEIAYNEEGRPDLLFKLWVQARDAYRQAHGLDEDQQIMVTDVLKYLRDNPHAVRIKDDLVVGIEPRNGGGRR